ncbi:DUF3022 domain-containing protein [Halovulum dunhuangense]|uniref:DUF3022 domain-containing protein n=1 Tax=Halovulum dunhuangense TaxID=1505036 RepID=A0A849L5F8_9RHOB|nr:BrnA antitoxin family protein [Halovulum dunhuangense]NNU81615.1 DUF3022 domain-containing protein [Halovulum dunhuangense]
MTERKRTRAEEKAYIQLLINLNEQESWIRAYRKKQTLIPSDWYSVERKVPVTPKRSKVTLRVDDRALRWFRRMGPGWQARVDAVLQAYMLSVISKEIEGEFDRDWKGDPI